MSLAVIWQGPGESLSVGAKVVKRADWARLVSSAQALNQACEREALSQERSLAIEKASRERGHAVGLRLGREEGLRQVLGQLHEKQRVIEALNEELVDVVEKAVRGLLGAAGDEQLLRAQVQQAIAAARAGSGARLIVPLAHVDNAKRLAAECLGDPAPSWLVVQGDAALSGCDVVLEAEGAIFDGRIDAQVAHWRDAVADLLGVPARHAPAGAKASTHAD